MASRIIHLAVAHELAARLEIKDTERFLYGHILPDMIMGEYEYRVPIKKETHFYTLLPNNRKTYDFYRFYEEYRDRFEDMLYLGYYVHLIEDNIFRQYLYYRVGLLKRRGERKLLDELYEDYRLLNPILIKKYNMKPLKLPNGIEKEGLYKRFDFMADEWLDDMKDDFEDSSNGKLMHFTEELIEEYIIECVSVISNELKEIQKGRHYLSINDYSIENYYKGELRK